MQFKTFACILTVLLPFVHAGTPQPGTKICSEDIQGLCSHDFEVINSTFGIILPPRTPQKSTLFEDDFIFKMVQDLPYGCAGMTSDASNGTLHFVAAGWWVSFNKVNVPSTPGISMVSSAIRAQLMVNGTSQQGSSAFALQSFPAGQPVPCNIRISPFYLRTNEQITAYIRLQGCQMIRTASPTTVGFFRSDASAIYADSSMESVSFPLDSALKTGSVLVQNIDEVRTSTESYNAALSALQLD